MFPPTSMTVARANLQPVLGVALVREDRRTETARQALTRSIRAPLGARDVVALEHARAVVGRDGRGRRCARGTCRGIPPIERRRAPRRRRVERDARREARDDETRHGRSLDTSRSALLPVPRARGAHRGGGATPVATSAPGIVRGARSDALEPETRAPGCGAPGRGPGTPLPRVSWNCTFYRTRKLSLHEISSFRGRGPPSLSDSPHLHARPGACPGRSTADRDARGRRDSIATVVSSRRLGSSSAFRVRLGSSTRPPRRPPPTTTPPPRRKRRPHLAVPRGARVRARALRSRAGGMRVKALKACLGHMGRGGSVFREERHRGRRRGRVGRAVARLDARAVTADRGMPGNPRAGYVLVTLDLPATPAASFSHRHGRHRRTHLAGAARTARRARHGRRAIRGLKN